MGGKDERNVFMKGKRRKEGVKKGRKEGVKKGRKEGVKKGRKNKEWGKRGGGGKKECSFRF